MSFLALMGEKIIHRGKDYLLTSSGDEYQLLLFNGPAPYYDGEQYQWETSLEKKININLFNLPEAYTITKYDLNEEQQTLLTETYKGFVRSGALLNDDDKKKLEKINIDLSMKSLQFGQNVLASTNAYFKHIENKEDLKGIPDAILAQYAEDAKEKNLEGYVITLQYPSYLPAMTYAENRDLRKELALANGKKSFDGGEFDNKNLIKEIISLRQQKAELLGYKNYAD